MNRHCPGDSPDSRNSFGDLHTSSDAGELPEFADLSRSQGSPSGEHDNRSLSDGATFGDQSLPDPSSLGDVVTFGDGLGGSEAELFDETMEIVDLESRYRIESTLGRGGMGEVLLAFDTRLDRHVAIKRVLGKSVRNAKALQRFLNGAKRVASLNHPNIVQVYDFGMAKDGPFMILEYVRGASLLDRCLEGVIPLDEAVEIICQLCDGLGKAHDAGVVHRDIKPANILMTEEGRPKLNDFDLAKVQATDAGMTMRGAILGTLDFMPPEQRRDAALVAISLNQAQQYRQACRFVQAVGTLQRIVTSWRTRSRKI